MKFIVAFLFFLFSFTARAYLTPAGPMKAVNGSVSAPSISFINSADAGLYRIGADDIGLAVAGILGLEAKKSAGSFVNLGVGGSASSSDGYPLYMKRSVTGPANMLLENENNSAGDGVKYQLKAGAGGSTFELGLFSLSTSAPDAYAGGRATMRCTDSCVGTSLIADGASTANHKIYAGGNAATDEVVRIHSTGLQIMTQNAKPTCDSSKRGTLYFTRGGAGVADQIEMCMKNSSDSYSWVVVKAAS